ncbi:hypothetical protein CEXT_737071, partial [Caerostris extrusa]
MPDALIPCPLHDKVITDLLKLLQEKMLVRKAVHGYPIDEIMGK